MAKSIRSLRHKRLVFANHLKRQMEEDYYWANQPDWDEDNGNRYEGYNSTDVLPYGGN